ncbi:MAG: acyl-CoA dehydrogenase family protein [Deltaproteobacteria bacterium]|nr:acyl-CoA dehydrogenase family protein [Deltaproteobacteria bacterium]
MDYQFNPEQEAFREESSSWLAANLPADFDHDRRRNYETVVAWKIAYKRFQKKLFDAGYAGMNCPKKYGGQGRSVVEEAIVLQTLASTCSELRRPGFITHSIELPTILAQGSEEQKKEMIPKMLDGTHIWCQGFSEPDAGSDVANVSTKAVKEGDHYVVNGQKVWTSFAHIADYCVLLVRTDPNVPKHKGLSYLLVDMTLPGIDVRPMLQITREGDFNEVFFDDVKVPVDMLVGRENQGWQIAITTLMFERVIGDVVMGAVYENNILSMVNMAQETKRSGKPVIDGPVFRQEIARSYIEVMVLKYHGLRNFSTLLESKIPGPEGSIGKILWSEPYQRLAEAAVGMQGPNGQVMSGSPWCIDDGDWQFHFIRSKGSTIEGGTSEIQRNIIGERVLGLPKDRLRAKV